MNKQRVAILLLAILGVSATFMPWTTVPILGSMPGTETKIAWFCLAFFMVPVICALIGDKSTSIRRFLLVVTIITSIIASGLGGIQYYALKNPPEPEEGDIFAGIFNETFTIGYGVYVVILTGIAIPIFGLLLGDPRIPKSSTITVNEKTGKRVKRVRKRVEPKSEEQEDFEKMQLEKERVRKEKEDPSRFMP